MKTPALLLLTLLVGTVATAQKPPLSATLTNPGNKTLAVLKNPKIPPLLVSCLMSNGKPGKLPGAIQENAFVVSLSYSTGSFPTLNSPIKYLQLANPVTFEKVQLPMNKLSDWTEAAMSLFLHVDFKN